MNTRKITDMMGELTVRTTKLQHKKFYFPLNTLPDWYPFNNNYEWRYSERTERLYLAMAEPKLEYTDYYIDSNEKRSESDYASFSPYTWYCAAVKADNDDIIEKAIGLDIYTFEDCPTNEELETNARKLCKLEQVYMDKISKEVLKTLDQEEYKTYLASSLEGRSSILLNRCTDENNTELQKIGKLYVMQGLMRKTNRRV